MAHHHHHGPDTYHRAFAWAVGLNLAFVIIEAVYAILANSMSLLADAGHNLGDVLGLVFAWIASWLMTRQAGERFSYGHRKTSIMAALVNALLLVATSALIAYESIRKLIYPQVVDEMTVIIVALIGIVINGGTAILFMRGRHDDLNIKGAFLHLAYDALISLGVVLTGLLILWTGLYWLDPMVGLLIVVAIMFGTYGLLRDSWNLMLDAVPRNIDQDAVRQYLEQLPGVESIHDLHIWGLSTRESALTAHLFMPERALSDDELSEVNDRLHDMGIEHVTLQVERSEQALCRQADGC